MANHKMSPREGGGGRSCRAPAAVHLHHGHAVGVADRLRNTPASQGQRHVPHARRCFGTAYPLLFFLFWLCGCYSLCLQKHALGLHTAQKGPKCPSNDRVRNAPSTQGPRHVPHAWHCFGKAYPLLFFLFWLCSCYSPCTEGCPWSGGVRHVNRVRRC